VACHPDLIGGHDMWPVTPDLIGGP
jgi:hypothetical protein